MQCFDPSTSGDVRWQGEYFGSYFSETLHKPKTDLHRHSHRLGTFNFVLSGRYCEDLAATSGVSEKNEFVYKPPHEPHENRFGSNSATCLLVEFTEPRFYDLVEHLPWLNRTTQASSANVKIAGIKLLRELRSNRSSKALAVESRLLDLLLAVEDSTCKTNGRPPIWLQQIEEYLRDNWQSSFSFEHIASEFDVHATHVAREFKRYYHKTVGDFIRHIRLERGAQLLAATDTPISQISLDCGFSDQSHFCRWFKRTYSVTPLQYRKSR